VRIDGESHCTKWRFFGGAAFSLLADARKGFSFPFFWILFFVWDDTTMFIRRVRASCETFGCSDGVSAWTGREAKGSLHGLRDIPW